MEFKAKEIALVKHNMIEASAGTGKTFSIAMLVLRMIMETDKPLKKMLIVTFTNPAVAELEIRIRKFIREAYRCITGEEISTKEIMELTEHEKTSGISNELLRMRLHRAVTSLDELNVMTIHSFCYRVIREFSLESDHYFESEIVTDESETCDYVLNQFLRKEVSVLDPDLLEELLESYKANQEDSKYKKMRNFFSGALYCMLDGRKLCIENSSEDKTGETVFAEFESSMNELELDFIKFATANETQIRSKADENCNSRKLILGKSIGEIATQYLSCIDPPQYLKADLTILLERYAELKKPANFDHANLTEYLIANMDFLKSEADNNTHAVKFLKEIQESLDKEEYMDKKIGCSAYLRNNFPLLYPMALEKIISEKKLRDKLNADMESLLLSILYHNYFPLVAKIKNEKTQFGYNDQISLVHKALSKVNSALAARYDVLFIDEFQDTDKYQYEIFSNVFREKTIFYIGDPKQSIYGWRKADLNTYNNAKKLISDDNMFDMKENFRSTPDMIRAMNLFFSSTENIFIDEKIKFNEVRPGKEIPEMKAGDDKVIPITIVDHDEESLKKLLDKEEPTAEDYHQSIIDFVCSETSKLLQSTDYILDGRQSVKPSDIGILVRKNEDAAAIKLGLSRRNIHSITLDETKVLESPEASHIRFIMLAVNRPSAKTINRALLNRNFGYDTIKLANLRADELLEKFTDLKLKWRSDGIYGMLSAFIEDFRVRVHCLNAGNSPGQRSLANYYQIMEILHDFETSAKRNEDQLIAKLARAEKSSMDEDEYVQRLESDADAVIIQTIHKCKGLQYRIVFAPFLDMNAWTSGLVKYRNDEGEYCFGLKNNLEGGSKNLNEIREENRRLIYVSLTRAIYKCYINVNHYAKMNGSSLKPLVESVRSKSGELIEFVKADQITKAKPAAAPSESVLQVEARSVNGIAPFEKKWDIHSFSSMSHHKHHIFTAEVRVIEDAYDNFVFNDMPKGAKAGSFLHSIFEHLDFTEPKKYREYIENSGGYYSTVYVDDHKDYYYKLVEQCMNVSIIEEPGKSFSLNQVLNENKLPELEFYFSLENHQKAEIQKIISDIEFSTDPEIVGMMHGFIDLLFLHNGKYYILDWKSNFIGNSLSDYEDEGMALCMKANNYHLQYHIYTVAVKRWLSRKIPNFDYEKDFGGVIYMFLRGVRSNDPGKGVYFKKPPLEKINQLERLFGQPVNL